MRKLWKKEDLLDHSIIDFQQEVSDICLNLSESGGDVSERISTFLTSLHREFKKEEFEKNVVLITHGLTCRLFLTRYFHWDVSVFQDLYNFESKFQESFNNRLSICRITFE